MKPSFGETNLGALVGSIVGATGGLFAGGIARAILEHNVAMLLLYPPIALICMLISGISGWILGGQLGPRFADKYNTQRAEVTGGAIGGVAPVILIALWGWYMKTH